MSTDSDWPMEAPGHVIRVSGEEFVRILELIHNPPSPSAAAVEFVRRHKDAAFDTMMFGTGYVRVTAEGAERVSPHDAPKTPRARNSGDNT